MVRDNTSVYDDLVRENIIRVHCYFEEDKISFKLLQ